MCPSYCENCRIENILINGKIIENFICLNGCKNIRYFNRNIKNDLTCPCQNGYVDNSLKNDVCVPCHYSCLNCYGIT